MDNEKLVENWRKVIIDECQKRLERDLNAHERAFISSRSGFLVFETIEDTVRTLQGVDLEKYLNSDKKTYVKSCSPNEKTY